jgi:hypothetical protein
MAFNFKSLEQYFLASEKNKQPVGTTVDPLGKFAPRPIQQQFSRAINFPTQKPNAPFIFIPGYSTSKLAELVQGKEIEGRDKAFSLEGQAFDPRDKAFSKKGPDFTTQKINTDKNQQAFTTEEINISQKNINYTTQNPINPMASTQAFTTQNPTNPMASTQAFTTQNPASISTGPAFTTQNPINPMASTQAFTTQNPINPMMLTPAFTTQNPINPMASTPAKDEAMLQLFAGLTPGDRIPLFSSPGAGRINHMNNMTSGFLNISPQPDERNGITKFIFNEDLPRGGSYSAFTRLQYNKYFERVSPTDGFGSARIPSGVTSNSRKMKVEDSKIDNFYKKVGKNEFVDIRTEAARNNPRTPLWLPSPFIQRGIQRGKDNPSGIFERISLLTAPVIDTVRIAKYMVSPDGLMFNLKQFGLQTTNPKKQFWQLGLPNADRIYNPLALALQPLLSPFGIHGDRHFLGQLNTRDITYEKIVKNIDAMPGPAGSGKGGKNRLVGLAMDMGSGLWDKNPVSIVPKKLKGLMSLYSKFTAMLRRMRGAGEPIKRLSGIMGPHSFFGIGYSTIYRAQTQLPTEVYFYNPVKPYHAQKATNHFDSQFSSGGSLAKKGTPHVGDNFNIIPYDDSKNKPPSQDSPDDWHGFPKEAGDIDPTGTNLGTYKTKTYIDIQKKFGNDEGTNKYENPDLTNWNQSKFNSEDDFKDPPTAFARKGDEDSKIDLKVPANTGSFDGGKKSFKVFDYITLGKYRREPKAFRDFRKHDANDAYEENSVKRIGISDYGATKPGTSISDTKYDKDHVNVKVAGVTFRSYITEMSDALKPSYSEITYAGNPVSAYMLDKISRDFSFSFRVPAFTSEELINNYTNLNSLMVAISPKEANGVLGGRVNHITVGNLWIKKPCIIDSLDYDIDLDAGWDIGIGKDNETSQKQLPMLFDIKIGGKFLLPMSGVHV